MQQLFSEFKPTSAAEWKAQLIKDLKGESFETLVWKNENGFDVQPFYTTEDLEQSYEPAFTHMDWEICVAGKSTDAKALNAQLLTALNGGATSISIHTTGLDLDIALQGVQLNYIRSVFYTTAVQAPALKSFLEKNYKLQELNCSVFPDKFNSSQDLEDWRQVISLFKEHKNSQAFCLDAFAVHNQNCFAYYEVAVIMAGLNEYLNAFAASEFPKHIVVKTGVSSDYFIQVAKLRAIRRLWKIISAEYKVQAEIYLIVETSSTNKSISDNYNNLLRTTVEAMAAVAGGCNELIVDGFDLLFPVNAILSARMAINQQLILKDESYFDKMADVACGAYYIESITDAIAGKALEALKHLEVQGGYFKCLEKNSISTEMDAQAKQRNELVADQKQIAIGVNKFRNDKEQLELGSSDLKRLQQLPIHNPVLNFELGHYFKQHA